MLRIDCYRRHCTTSISTETRLFLRSCLAAVEPPSSAQVEPFQRFLSELNVDMMINGRRRDHGFERAHLEVRMRFMTLNYQPLKRQ